jgi:hypothetical protein
MQIGAIFAVLALTVVLSASSIGAERKATSLELRTTVDPAGSWRVMRRDDATSDCIGDPVTPICAVETQIACFDRAVVELCLLAYRTSNPRSFNLNYAPVPDLIDRYRIETIGPIRPLKRSGLPVRKRNPASSGASRDDDLYLHVRLDKCAQSRGSCAPDPANGLTCEVRPAGSRWRVLECYADGLGENE